MKYTRADLLVFLMCLIAGTAYYLHQAPQQVPSLASMDMPTTMKHLEHISQEPHAIGTKAHQEVGDYIIQQAKKNGLQVELQIDTISGTYRNCTQDIVQVRNILVAKAGQDSDDIVMLAGHYDTHPNTPGTSDDGTAIAVMLQQMEYYAQQSTKNSLLFMFTDAEEIGLYGAQVFMNNYPHKDKIKQIINVEARGNDGPALFFETNVGNQQTIRDVSRFKHVRANALMYEVYKRLPNNSDFSHYKKLDANGVNMANIDGFVHYHAPTDNLQYANKTTIQHHQYLIAEMMHYYANTPLKNKAESDSTYFNLLSFILVVYPPIINLIMLLISVLLVPVFMKKTMYDYRFKKVLLAVLSILLGIVACVFSAYLYLLVLKQMYPHYGNFYSFNFYNAGLYFYCFLALTILVFLGVLNNLKDWLSIAAEDIHLAGIGLSLIIGFLLYIYIPSASYIISFPLFFYVVGYICCNMYLKEALWAMVLPAIFAVMLYSPVSHLLFTVFSLGNPMISMMPVFIVLLLIYPALRSLSSYWLWLCIGMLVLCHIRAHNSSVITKHQPVQTHSYYFKNKNSQEIRSNRSYISPPEKALMYQGEITKQAKRPYRSSATDLDIPTPLQWQVDTSHTAAGIQYSIRLDVKPSSKLLKLQFTGSMLEQAKELKINGQTVDNRSCEVNYYGLNSSYHIDCLKEKASDELELKITSFQSGLLDKLEVQDYIVTAPGYFAGSILHEHIIKI